MVVLCKCLTAVCTPYGDVYHLWQNDSYYYIIQAYDMITLLATKLTWYLYVALLSCPYRGALPLSIY